MPPSYFPLRWESTGDQWWYASPIDCAAANGHYDLVRELLHIDSNLLIKLTSLRRIRRLETVWDDEEQFDDVAKCRSHVAKSLLMECETKGGLKANSLIRAGYGGWLIYTAASAADVEFVRELFERDPLLVYGEGEFGVTDIFYAAARSKNSEVFRLLFEFSVSPKSLTSNSGEVAEVSSVFRWEMLNRAVHAAARGGNLEILKELIVDGSDVLVFRDAQGSTLLHAASARGQVEIVKDLVASFDIINSTDSRGNSALHIAACRGHLSVVKVLIVASPSTSSLTNYAGDTFLHLAVAGFRTPGFRRLDRQIDLIKNLLCGNTVNMDSVINITNNDGKTALHMAFVGNVHYNLVELLMSVPSINFNIRDMDGYTPLDLLTQVPRSMSSDLLIKQFISAGGISYGRDCMARRAVVSQLKVLGIGNSPGTSFRIPDSEIFLYTGIEALHAVDDHVSEILSSCSSEISNCDSPNKKKPGRLKNILRRWKEKKFHNSKKMGDDDSVVSYMIEQDTPTSLRQRFSKPSGLMNNKRILSVRNNLPSPSTKKKFVSGLMHGLIQAMPYLSTPVRSHTSSFSISSMSSPISSEKLKVALTGDDSVGPSCSNQSVTSGTPERGHHKSPSLNKKLMNQFICFGGKGLAVDEPVTESRLAHEYISHSALPVA